MKGFVSFIELVTAIIILIVAFTILFPPFQYNTRWGEALTLTRGRDIVSSLASSGKMYKYTFNSTLLTDFLDQTLNETNLIYSYSTQGTPKEKIFIACNCTLDEINELQKWLAGLEVNGREIEFVILYSNLDEINNPNKRSDLLIIFGNKTLEPFKDEIEKYLERENGIILVADPSLEQVGPNGDKVYREIFGLGNATSQEVGIADYDEFRTNPNSTKELIYKPWKYFYRVPVPIFTSPYYGPIPVENLAQPSCSLKANGTFKINVEVYTEDSEVKTRPASFQFWVCDSAIYIDTDYNGTADTRVQEGGKFHIVDFYDNTTNFTFVLNYIKTDKIGISFRPNYKFHDFIPSDFGYTLSGLPGVKKGIVLGKAKAKGLVNRWGVYNVLAPIEGEEGYKRILIQANNKTAADEPIPGIILNSSLGRTAWIADFTKEGVGDDERMLLAALILWASNKNPRELFPISIKLGYTTSYLNVENKDMYEVYRFDLTLGYPY